MIINKILTLVILTVLLMACTEQTPSIETKEAPKQQTAPEQTVEVEQPKQNGFESPLAFNLKDLDGNQVQASEFRGKWLFINYWATWCAPCRDEMPELVKFQEENADKVQVVGIAFEDATVEKLKNFAKDFNINYPLLTIDVYNPPEFAEEGGLGLPTTIVYDAEGMRHKKHMGPIDAAGLSEMMQ